MPSEKQQEYKDNTLKENEEIYPNPELNENVDELTEDLDALLDEIDEILEEDSEEFVEKLYPARRAVGLLKLHEYGTNDFLQVLKNRHPDQLGDWTQLNGINDNLPHNYLEGTTVLALVYNDGVIIAGDRQATEGYQVGERRIQKVYRIDQHSAIAVAGVAGPCIETAKTLSSSSGIL